MAKLRKIFVVCTLQALIQLFYKEGLAQAPVGEADHSNITTPISVGNGRLILTPTQNIFWVSPNNTFALGFLAVSSSSPSSPSFTLSLFYSYLSQFQITPVWSPHRGRPVTQNASLVLTEQGDLVLSDSGTQIWRTNTAQNRVASFSISDAGNILLYGLNFTIIWQSWDEPITDTLLPGQTLYYGSHLVDSSGRYMLRMQEDRNVVLYFLGALSRVFYTPYWASGTNNENITQAYYNASQGLVLVNNRTGHTGSTLLQSSSSSHNLERMVLLESGTFTRYILSDDDGKTWSPIARAPSYICYVFGLCGPYGICRTQGDADNNINITIDDKIGYTCTCPNRFEYVDPNDWSMGCRTDYPIDCDRASNLTRLPGLQYGVPSPNTPSWSFYHYYNALSTEDECAHLCTASCECAAATYDGAECHLCNIGQASAGNMRDSTSVTYLKTSAYPANNSSQNNTSLQLIGKEVKGREIISTGSAVGIGLALGLACIVGCVYLAWWYHMSKSKEAHMNEEINDELPLLGGRLGPVHFSYKNLKAASNGFTNLLGRGGFGPVYKGVLAGGAVVAIKMLQGSTYGEKQFMAEVITIGSVHHINLVRLCGYCAKGPHRMLVYEFMPKGSLDKYIFHDDSTQLEHQGLLNWESRFQILLSTARAIRYLHEECQPCIVHCDIKPENILLDEAFNSKVSDFGMAQLVGSEAGQTGSITRVRGTIGYMAPEWMSSKRISTKADVYSFGIVVLEVISGRRAIDTDANSVSKIDLSTWAYSQVMEHCVALTILDPCLRLASTSNVLPLPDAPQQATSNISGLPTTPLDVPNHVSTSENYDRLVILDASTRLATSDLAHVAPEFHRAALVALWCIHKDPSIRPSMGLVVQILEGIVPVDTPPYPF